MTNPIIKYHNQVVLEYSNAELSIHSHYFIGKNEAEANQQMEKWVYERTNPDIVKVTDDESENIGEVVGELKRGRGESLVGTVWMLNKQLKSRKRVSSNEAIRLKAEGWIAGGPKTPFD